MNTHVLTKVKHNIAATIASASMVLTNFYIAHSDAFDEASKVVSSTQSKIVDLAKVLFPFSLVCLIVAILFTHDQKALAVELKTALVICVAYAALLLVTTGDLAGTISGLFS